MPKWLEKLLHPVVDEKAEPMVEEKTAQAEQALGAAQVLHERVHTQEKDVANQVQTGRRLRSQNHFAEAIYISLGGRR